MGVVSGRVYVLLFYLVLLLACLLDCLFIFFLSFFAVGWLTNSWNRSHFNGRHGEGPVSEIHETSLKIFHEQKLLSRN